MANVLIGILPTILSALEKFIPDSTQRAQAATEIFQTISKSDEIQGQINLAEAQSPSLFKSGWRPATGWLCLAGLAYDSVFRSLITWACQLNQWPIPPPMDTGTLVSLLTGLLGLGGYRMAEKIKGVA